MPSNGHLDWQANPSPICMEIKVLQLYRAWDIFSPLYVVMVGQVCMYMYPPDEYNCSVTHMHLESVYIYIFLEFIGRFYILSVRKRRHIAYVYIYGMNY